MGRQLPQNHAHRSTENGGGAGMAVCLTSEGICAAAEAQQGEGDVDPMLEQQQRRRQVQWVSRKQGDRT